MNTEPAEGGIVVVGASAGGLASLQAVLSRLPASFPHPVLVVQHSDPRRESHLVDILARDAKLELRTAVDGEVPLPGSIYICPSSMGVQFGPRGALALSPATGHPPRSVTTAFVTAAEVYGDGTVAVILSGTGTDGAAGAMEVKRRGGCVVAESEASAAHFGMPRATIQAGAADFVCAATDIARVLADVAGGERDAAEPESAAEMAAILEHVRRERGTQFDQYRPASIRRRLRKHMFLGGHTTYGEYLAALRSDPAEVDALVDTLLINVSGFFRDAQAFLSLEKNVVPVLADKLQKGSPVRVWVAGCATGEEAYSLAILLTEAVDPSLWDRIKVFATDLDAAAIQAARKGRYTADRVAGLSERRLQECFTPVEDGFELKKAIRRLVVFGVHDLTKSAPIANLDLVSCRNVLIYFDTPLQRRIMKMFDLSLTDGGFLFLGRSEAVGADSTFVPVDRRARIFRAGSGPRPYRARTPFRGWSGDELKTPDLSSGLPTMLADHLLENAGLVIVMGGPDGGRVVFANREARALAVADPVAEGLPLGAAFPWLTAPAIEDALRDARAGRRTRLEAFEGSPKGRRMLFDLDIAPLDGEGAQALLIGEDVTAREDLRRLLRERGAALQESVEDLQTTNEELQAANEELETANEELQSTNEELTTLNEELQSTNEELETTNEELQSTTEELDNLNRALDETRIAAAWTLQMFRTAADASEDAIIGLDPDECVTLWSRQAREFFGDVEDEVLGRSVFSARLHVLADALKEGLRDAAASVGPVEIADAVVVDRDHARRHLRIRIQGLRTPDGAPGGWVVTCHDLTSLRATSRAGEEASARYAAFLRATGEGVLAVDAEGRIVDPTPRAVELLTGGRHPMPVHVWEVTDDPGRVFEIKGALAALALGAGRKETAHKVHVVLDDKTRLSLTFVAADVPGVAPIVLVRPLGPPPG